MADNVAITAGAGTTIATDEVNTGGGNAHVQLVKLLDGTDGGTERIQGTAANGLEVDVTRLPALAAGTNNIGDVDVLSIVPGTGATNLGKAEDAAHTSGDVGVMALSVRQDTAAALGQTDADYQPLITDASGRLHVNVGNTVTVASHAVTNAGTFATQVDGAALTALQLIDNLVLLEDAAHQSADPGIQMLAVRDDTLNVRSGAENDYEPLHTDANGALWTQDVNSAAIVGHVDGIEGLLTTIDTDTGNIATSTAGAATSLAVMDDWDNGASDGASVSGDVAHDTADAGEPVKLGHKAIDLGANPTDVAANDRTNWYAMRNGVPFVMGGAPFVKSQNLQVTDADGAQTDAAILTAAANVAIMVTALEVTADHANTGDVSCRIGFGTANTPAADADKVIMFHPGIAPGSGLVKGSGSGIIGAGLSGEDLRVTCEDPAGGSLSIVVTYFTLAIG